MSFFNGLDANKDGKLTADEFAGPMADVVLPAVGQAAIAGLIR